MCTVSIAMLSPSASRSRIRHDHGLRRRHVEQPSEARARGDDAKVERPALRPQAAAPHVVGERRHRQLLRDLRLADERARAVPPNEVALAHEVVERGPYGQARDAEVGAELTLRRDRVADGELLDEVEHEVSRRRLLRHAAHRNPAPRTGQDQDARQCATSSDSGRRAAVRLERARRRSSTSKKWKRARIDGEPERGRRRAPMSVDRRAR